MSRPRHDLPPDSDASAERIRPSSKRSRQHSRNVDGSDAEHRPIPPPHRSSKPLPPRAAMMAAAAETGAFDDHSSTPPWDSSSANALRDLDNLFSNRIPSVSPEPTQQPYQDYRSPHLNSTQDMSGSPSLSRLMPRHQEGDSQSSLTPLVRPQPPPISPSPSRFSHASFPVSPDIARTLSFHDHHPRGSYYHGDGYDAFDPTSIADDDDDGLEERPQPRQRSSRFFNAVPMSAENLNRSSDPMLSQSHAPLQTYNRVNGRDPEKSEWLQQQSSGSRRMRWVIGSILALLIVGGIVGGAIGGVLSQRNAAASNKSSSNSASGSSSSSSSSNGLYDIHSPQVRAVLNNANLHKVFPGMDYTPLNAQYPACLIPEGGPDQNNVTIDIAILSQLTPAVRLYGTDCNQTEMVLTAINQLGFNDSMKVWLGVFLGANLTTNARQLAQMYTILETYPTSHFAGLIIGNEVLFAKTLPEQTLIDTLTSVRSNLTALNISLPVATSDIGANWNAELAKASDIVMANVHPFFAGVTAKDGANWAWSFWQSADVPLTSSVGTAAAPKQIISEIGWPSQGGHDCGGDPDANYGCTGTADGAVANVTEMNAFMDVWVCQALSNGTEYFWFEAFDEPWKHSFDTDDDHWEPYWGLMDLNRNLKSGVTIPDCQGHTVA